MLELTQYALLSTALGTALFHTLIPDHWLPFVLIGRARGWSAGHTAFISGLSAALHTVLSIGLGLLVLVLGYSAVVIGETLADIAPFLLMAFGLGYAVWAWRKGGHFHPGGDRLHPDGAETHCEGSEGDTHPEHLHYHADDRLITRDGQRGGYWLALIVGGNPCILLIPIYLSAAPQGTTAVVQVTLAYTIPTVTLMVGLSVIGVVLRSPFRVPGIARYTEMASGLLIALTGVVVLLIEARLH